MIKSSVIFTLLWLNKCAYFTRLNLGCGSLALEQELTHSKTFTCIEETILKEEKVSPGESISRLAVSVAFSTVGEKAQL